MIAWQVLNTKGAARRLGCSQIWIHKLVSTGKLKAYTYDEEGVLVEHKPEEKRQGQGLYFVAEEVDTYQPQVRRRPRGSNNKQIRLDTPGAKTAWVPLTCLLLQVVVVFH